MKSNYPDSRRTGLKLACLAWERDRLKKYWNSKILWPIRNFEFCKQFIYNFVYKNFKKFKILY